ncbi:hypothetical protein HHJ81_09125 [Mobiluncus mulieris]|uniref:Uncharacterized protein n=2 Tax=Mobiluncus mulieris TaxID=2052 RepID=E0QN72_9ACTO|nr:hypothetical protein HMPREF0580_0336 [Mobiluncus mulieris ATCC 35239]MCU9994983.1 hypothetical protein [Mobiluncus mulieris]MCU9996170.1 hypothetical protein [Mobiluncus mulieris]MCV0011368.1 hypothetical protein [Mobiluncus mulieris]MCV0013451.1 hypothetical protein [Mobiluncus mulieris]
MGFVILKGVHEGLAGDLGWPLMNPTHLTEGRQNDGGSVLYGRFYYPISRRDEQLPFGAKPQLDGARGGGV